MRRFFPGFLVVTAASALVVPGCDKTTDVAPLRDGKAECLEIGELCHGAGNEQGGRYEECHDIGHEGDGAACLAVYEECRDLCEAAPHGHGGAGGEGGGPAGGATH